LHVELGGDEGVLGIDALGDGLELHVGLRGFVARGLGGRLRGGLGGVALLLLAHQALLLGGHLGALGGAFGGAALLGLFLLMRLGGGLLLFEARLLGGRGGGALGLGASGLFLDRLPLLAGGLRLLAAQALRLLALGLLRSGLLLRGALGGLAVRLLLLALRLGGIALGLLGGLAIGSGLRFGLLGGDDGRFGLALLHGLALLFGGDAALLLEALVLESVGLGALGAADAQALEEARLLGLLEGDDLLEEDGGLASLAALGLGGLGVLGLALGRLGLLLRRLLGLGRHHQLSRAAPTGGSRMSSSADARVTSASGGAGTPGFP
jgi:hypothetical protein